MTTTDAVTSAHLLKSTPATFDLDADFAAQMRQFRAASAVDVLEQAAQRREARLSAEAQNVIDMTRRIWDETEPIEY